MAKAQKKFTIKYCYLAPDQVVQWPSNERQEENIVCQKEVNDERSPPCRT